MIVYRIGKARHARSIFSGSGGLEAGGRWHQRGRLIIYTAQTLSLAALEYLVHLGRNDPRMALVRAQAQIPANVAVEEVDPRSLPARWNASPPIAATMEIGTRWCAERRSAVLKVPSAVVPGEFNFLLNPEHPRFALIRLSRPKPFSFDPRLVKQR